MSTQRTCRLLGLLSFISIALLGGGCSSGSGKPTIQNKGSDTMLEVAQAWSEAYDEASVEVSGGGSGVGISFLIAGKVDVANCSRAIKAEEIEKVKASGGKAPVEIIVGYDALAIYVHKDNPLEEISLTQLKEVFGDSGSITKWSQLGVTVPGCAADSDIELAGRQSSSGTYEYFREAVLGKTGMFNLKANEQNGSRALVQFVASTPCSIGYSGMGYKTDAVKFVTVKPEGGVGVMPSAATVHDKSYPIARPLFLYTPGEAPAHVTAYANWVRSDAGQAVVEQIGYIPLPVAQRVSG